MKSGNINVLILKVANKPLRLAETLPNINFIVLKVVEPLPDVRILEKLKGCGECAKCDVAVFLSSYVVRILREQDIKVDARYYIAIGDDTYQELQDYLTHIRKIDNCSILKPSHYTSKEVKKLVVELMCSDSRIRVVHVYRSKIGEHKFLRCVPSAIVREFRLYDLMPIKSMLDLFLKLFPDVHIVVYLSSYLVHVAYRYILEVNPSLLSTLLEKPTVVLSEITESTCRAYGFRKVYVCDNASISSLVETIKRVVEHEYC